MSGKNEKDCCNCRHNIRQRDKGDMCYCECQLSGKRISYVEVMESRCRHWAKESEE